MPFKITLSVIFLSFAFSAHGAESNKRILVLHSYHKEYGWTKQQDAGIRMAFTKIMKPRDWSMSTVYMDTKRNTIFLPAKNETQIQKQSRERKVLAYISEIKNKIISLRPKAVILTDDNAFKYFGKWLLDQNIPVSVSGINGDLADYKYKGNGGVTGTLERYDLVPVALMLPDIRPTIKEIMIFADDSISGNLMANQFWKQINSDPDVKARGIRATKFIGNDWEALKKQLKSVNPATTAGLFVVLYSQKDKSGKVIDDYDSIHEWITKNTKIVDIGIAAFQMKENRLIAMAGSSAESGMYAATKLFRAILTGEPVTGVRRFMPLRLKLNHNRAQQLGIKFPITMVGVAMEDNFDDYKNQLAKELEILKEKKGI